MSAKSRLPLRPNLRRVWIKLCLGALLCLPGLGWSQAESVPENLSRVAPAYRGDRILIKPKPGTATNALPEFHEQRGTSVLKTFGGIGGWQVLQLTAGESIQTTVQKYEQSGMVDRVEPDFVVRIAATTPNDPAYLDGTLWGLNNMGQNSGTDDADIDAPEAWDALTSASNTVVAVLDTGVRYTHEDLAANMWTSPHDGSHGFNAINGSNDPKDDNGHGTRVAGILGGVGNNGKGVAGVAWRVQIMACKFIDRDGFGSISDAIACIEFARTNGAQVINASWGFYDFSMALLDAVSSAREADMIVVAAAGNDARNTDLIPFYPASFEFDNIVSVAATTREDDLVWYSNFGATSVDLAAPGTNIYSTDFLSDTAYAMDEGTSMATPFVTGAIALMLEKYPGETHQQIISRLMSATDPLPALAGKCLTGGRLNLRRAINPILRLIPKPAVPGGAFEFVVSGEPGQRYVLEATTNLNGWSPVFTNVTGPSGMFDFTDNRSTNAPERYYRAVASP